MTTTDRRDADDATFTAEMDRLNRLEVADIEADVREADLLQQLRALTAERDELDRQLVAALEPAPGTDSSGPASCGHLSPSINFGGDGEAERFMCELPHGHGGAHQRDNGDGLSPMRWIALDDSSGQVVQRDQVRALRKTAWDMGYRSCQTGDQMHTNPYARAAVAGPQRDHGGDGGQ